MYLISHRAKLDMTEASLTMSEQRVRDQTAMVELARKENLEQMKNYEAQMRKEREDRHNSEVRNAYVILRLNPSPWR